MPKVSQTIFNLNNFDFFGAQTSSTSYVGTLKYNFKYIESADCLPYSKEKQRNSVSQKEDDVDVAQATQFGICI